MFVVVHHVPHVFGLTIHIMPWSSVRVCQHRLYQIMC